MVILTMIILEALESYNDAYIELEFSSPNLTISRVLIIGAATNNEYAEDEEFIPFNKVVVYVGNIPAKNRSDSGAIFPLCHLTREIADVNRTVHDLGCNSPISGKFLAVQGTEEGKLIIREVVVFDNSVERKLLNIE